MGPESECADGRVFKADERLLPCGCWVPMEQAGPCAVHGEAERSEHDDLRERLGRLERLARRLDEDTPTWLDEVAARMMVIHRDLRGLSEDSVIVAKSAYDDAQVHLDEGKRRREAESAKGA